MSSTLSMRSTVVGAVTWLALAIAAGATGVLTTLRPPAPQVIALVLTIGAVLVSTGITDVRRSIDRIPTRALVGVHAVRFIGLTFLVLAARGEMNTLFAERAGWGDITIATLAVILALTGDPRTALRRWAFIAWNILGMIDLIVAVATAAIVVVGGDTAGMQPILRLPLVLVPIYIVPLLFVSHIALLRRLSLGRR